MARQHGGQARKSKYGKKSSEVRRMSTFKQKHSTKSWSESNPKRERLLASHMAGRGLKETQKQLDTEATGGVTVGGVDPRLYNPTAAASDPYGTYKAAKNFKPTSRTGQVDYDTGSVDAEYAIAAAIARGTGAPVPHEPSMNAHFDPRDPMRSRVGVSMGEDEAHISLGKGVKMAKQGLQKAGQYVVKQSGVLKTAAQGYQHEMQSATHVPTTQSAFSQMDSPTPAKDAMKKAKNKIFKAQKQHHHHRRHHKHGLFR